MHKNSLNNNPFNHFKTSMTLNRVHTPAKARESLYIKLSTVEY